MFPRLYRVVRQPKGVPDQPLLEHPEIELIRDAARRAVESVGSLAKQQAKKSPDDRSGSTYRVGSLRSFATVFVGRRALNALVGTWYEANKEVFDRALVQVLEEKYGDIAHIALGEPYRGDNEMTHDTSLNFVAELTFVPKLETKGRDADWLPSLHPRKEPTREAKERKEFDQAFLEAHLTLTKIDGAIETARASVVAQENIVRENQDTLERNESAAESGKGTASVAEGQVAMARGLLDNARDRLVEKREILRGLSFSRPLQEQNVESERLATEEFERSHKLQMVFDTHDALMLTWRNRESAPSSVEMGTAKDQLKLVEAELSAGRAWLQAIDARALEANAVLNTRQGIQKMYEGCDPSAHAAIDEHKKSLNTNLDAFEIAKERFEPRYEDLAFARDELSGLITEWLSAVRHEGEREEASKVQAQLDVIRQVPEPRSLESVDERLTRMESSGLAERRRQKRLSGGKPRELKRGS